MSQSGEKVDQFIEVFFVEGPLGVTLRRRPDDGIVFIHEIIPDSQAVNLNVQPMDELWAVGDSEIGETPLDKDAWNGLINFIKTSSRPLRLVLHRKPQTPAPEPPLNSPTTVVESTIPSQALPVPPSIPKTEVSSDSLELQRWISRLVVKDDEKSNSRKINPQSLLKEGRRILKQGDLSISGKNSLWGSKKYEKRRVTLCNDVLVITIPQSGNMYALEYVFDLPICKIRSLGHVFGAMSDASDPTVGSSQKVQPEDLLFDLVAPPMGELTFIAESKDVKDVWVLMIFLAICDNVGESERVLGWRHQYMLGTMHSAVICRDEQRIRELIALCNDEKLSFLSIEQPDEEGYTPLHYACIMRLHTIIELLHQATADVTATDRQGLTPLHWAAMQLDNYALSLLCEHVFDLDLPDPKDRTPLVMCIIEGRDIHGKTDPILLKECLTQLLPHKPNCHWQDKFGRTLVHYLAASWQYEALEVFLDADSSEVNAMDTTTGMTPLHYAVQAKPIKKAIGEAQRIMNRTKPIASTSSPPRYGVSSSPSSSAVPQVVVAAQSTPAQQALQEVEALHTPYGVDTIRALLKAGAKPNIRDCNGRTPLGLLLTDLDAQDRWLDREEILPAIAILISFGARVDLDPIGAAALRSLYPDLMVAAFVEKWTSMNSIDCNSLDVGANHFEVLDLSNAPAGALGARSDSNGNLVAASIDRRASTNMSPTDISSSNRLGNANNAVSSTPTKHPFAPDASKQCELCGFVYTLFRRQHHCRLCNCSCCDECSKKRSMLDDVAIRTCDVCFNRLHHLQEKAQEEARCLQRNVSVSSPNLTALSSGISPTTNGGSSTYTNAATVADKQQNEREERKLRLFGSSNTNNSSSQKTPQQQQQQTIQNSQAGVGRTMQTMNEVHERLQERGEKLSRMSDRTEEMANQANEFARLAKLLNEQQKSRWF